MPDYPSAAFEVRPVIIWSMQGSAGIRRQRALSKPLTTYPLKDQTRAARTLRGVAGAVIATLFAAVSHSLAGGDMTFLAILATSVLAMPLCVLLAGRIASVWRLLLAVGSAQFLYHWVFAGIGLGTRAPGEPAPLHAGHLAAIQSFTPTASPETADAIMWAGHAIAALLTVALLHRGEHALVALLQVLRRSILLIVVASIPPLRAATAEPLQFAVRPWHTRWCNTASITHRGPPPAVAVL